MIAACEIKDNYQLFRKSQNQLCNVAAVIPLWHNLVRDELGDFGFDKSIKEWFTCFLLPLTYWEPALKKTKYTLQREKFYGS
jgi:hypothetical protein